MYTYTKPNENTSEDFTGYMVDESSTYKDFDYHSIPRSREFNECCKLFNIEDERTRKVLLSVNEADQNVIMQSLASKLYQHIINKIDDVDFGTIPMSKGDITKIQNYEQLTDCLNILNQILQNYHQDVTPVDTVNITLQNMIDRKTTFMKAYQLNVEFPIVVYNTITLSIISAVSLLISSHIEFIKMADNKGYDIAFDKASRNKSKDKLLFNQLVKFNKMCSNGDLDKTIDYAMKNNIKSKHEAMEVQQEVNIGAAAASVASKVPVVGTSIAGFFGAHPIIAGIGAVILGLIALIYLIRALVYYFYYAKVKLSDYFDEQSSLLYMNATNIENSLTRDDRKKADTAKKQKAIADFFRKLSDKLKVKDRDAEDKARKDIKKSDEEKLNIDDVVSDIPDSANATLF